MDAQRPQRQSSARHPPPAVNANTNTVTNLSHSKVVARLVRQACVYRLTPNFHPDLITPDYLFYPSVCPPQQDALQYLLFCHQTCAPVV